MLNFLALPLLIGQLEAGIGLLIVKTEPFKVSEVIPCSPAQYAGVSRGALIRSIDSKSVAGLTYQEIVLLLRGDPGSRVVLTFMDRKGVAHTVIVERKIVELGCGAGSISSQDIFKKIQMGQIGEILVIVRRNPSILRARNKNGESPLMTAAATVNEKLVTAFVEAGADVTAADENGWTALHWATSEPASAFGPSQEIEPIVKELLTHGADPNSLSVEHWTPLMNAVHNNNTKVVKLLMLHGADPKIVNLRGDDSVAIARKQNNNQAEKILIGGK